MHLYAEILLTGIILLSLGLRAHSQSAELSDIIVSAEQSLVWGPGVDNPAFVVPVRWFFLQLVDTNGNNITQSVGKDGIHVTIRGYDNKGRTRVEVLDRLDGSYLVRYRLNQAMISGLEVRVDYREHDGVFRPVHNSPYALDEPVYHEECDMPQPDHLQWRADLDCPVEGFDQVVEDLNQFPTIDLDNMATAFQKHLGKDRPTCHYAIMSNRLYATCTPSRTDFRIRIEEFLLSLLRKVKMPDVEFIFNVGDYPIVDDGWLRRNQPQIPVFSWCGSTDSMDIVVPTWDMTRSVMHALGGVWLDMLSIQSMEKASESNQRLTWDEKDGRALFRGRDSRRERLELVDLSRQHPDLVDARLTAFFFYRNHEDKYGPAVPHIMFHDFFSYKYQINMDGTVAAYRLPFLLGGSDSVVFKQESKYYEHFYRDLVKGQHYIPFQRDLTDLVGRIRWARDNDELAYDIGKRGREYARENLSPNKIYCYYERVLAEYAKKQSTQPKIREGMEEVPQPTSSRYGEHSCQGSASQRTARPAHEEL